MVSRVIVAGGRVVVLPAASVAVTVMVFAPSARAGMTELQVVPLTVTGISVAPSFTVTVAPGSTIPSIVWFFLLVVAATAFIARAGAAASRVMLIEAVVMFPDKSAALSVTIFEPAASGLMVKLQFVPLTVAAAGAPLLTLTVTVAPASTVPVIV